MAFRAEHVLVGDSSGDLEICRGGGEQFLLIEGRPSVIAWPAASGYRQQCFIRAYDTGHVARRVRDLPMRSFGVDPCISLVEQVRPVLDLLPRGPYRVEHIGRLASDGHRAAGKGTRPLTEWSGIHIVPGTDPLLVGSLPREMLDPVRLAAPPAPGGPVVILLSMAGSSTTFLVLGHEEMEASRLTGVAPVGVLITSEAPRTLSAAERQRLVCEAWVRCAQLTAPSAAVGPAMADRVG